MWGQAAHSSRLNGYGSYETVTVGEAYDTMAAGMEGCGAVQRAADGADVVEADRCQQVAAWLSGWAWRRVCRPAWGLKRSCRQVRPHQPLACPVDPGLAGSPAGLEHAWSCCRRAIDPATLLNPRPLAPGVARATMKQPLDILSCATIRISSATCGRGSSVDFMK